MTPGWAEGSRLCAGPPQSPAGPGPGPPQDCTGNSKFESRCALTVLKSLTVYGLLLSEDITGRNAAQRWFHPTRSPSTGWCTFPAAVPFPPPVPFSTRVPAGMKPPLGRDSSVNMAPAGFPGVKTPTIDALAAGGVILDNYYVDTVCSPVSGQQLIIKLQAQMPCS